MVNKNGRRVLGTVGKLALTVSVVSALGIMASETKQESSGVYMSSETRIFDKDSPYAYSEILEFAESLQEKSETEHEIEYLTEEQTEPETIPDSPAETGRATNESTDGVFTPVVLPEASSETVGISVDTEVFESEPTEYTVYWVKSGEVWHISEKCRSLARSKTVLSGSVDEAIAAGKSRACKICA